MGGQMVILLGDQLRQAPRWAYSFNYQNMPHIIYVVGVLTWVQPQTGQYPMMVQLAIEHGSVGKRRVLVVCDEFGTRVVADFMQTDYYV
jgi:hypothetical protein